VNILKPNDRISIILFENNARLKMNLKNISKSRDLIDKAISQISAGGGTNIASGLDKAFETMINRKSYNDVTSI